MVRYISLSLYTTCFGYVWSIINTSLCSLFEWCSLRRRCLIWVRGLISGDAVREFLKEIQRSAHTVHLCVLYGYPNKQRFIPYTALTDRFLTQTKSVYCAVRAGCVNTVHLLHLPTFYRVSTLHRSHKNGRAGQYTFLFNPRCFFCV